MIRILDLFPLPTRVLRAFRGARKRALGMRATIGLKRTHAAKSSLCASVSLW